MERKSPFEGFPGEKVTLNPFEEGRMEKISQSKGEGETVLSMGWSGGGPALKRRMRAVVRKAQGLHDIGL